MSIKQGESSGTAPIATLVASGSTSSDIDITFTDLAAGSARAKALDITEVYKEHYTKFAALKTVDVDNYFRDSAKIKVTFKARGGVTGQRFKLSGCEIFTGSAAGPKDLTIARFGACMILRMLQETTPKASIVPMYESMPLVVREFISPEYSFLMSPGIHFLFMAAIKGEGIGGSPTGADGAFTQLSKIPDWRAKIPAACVAMDWLAFVRGREKTMKATGVQLDVSLNTFSLQYLSKQGGSFASLMQNAGMDAEGSLIGEEAMKMIAKLVSSNEVVKQKGNVGEKVKGLMASIRSKAGI